MQEAWSWRDKPINITCLAESIPNASISWRLNDVELNERYIDNNIKKFGEGPLSSLQVSQIYLSKAVYSIIKDITDTGMG